MELVTRTVTWSQASMAEHGLLSCLRGGVLELQVYMDLAQWLVKN